MTAEDFNKPDRELMKSELDELIKEARAKILPVFQILSDDELKSLIKSVEEVKGDKQVRSVYCDFTKLPGDPGARR